MMEKGIYKQRMKNKRIDQKNDIKENVKKRKKKLFM